MNRPTDSSRSSTAHHERHFRAGLTADQPLKTAHMGGVCQHFGNTAPSFPTSIEASKQEARRGASESSTVRRSRGAGGALVTPGIYLRPVDLFVRFRIPGKFSFEADFLQRRIDELRPVALACDGVFIDIGMPDAYREAQQLLPSLLAIES